MDILSKHLRAFALTGCAVLLGASVAVSFADDTGVSARVARFIDGFITGSSNDIRDTNVPFAGTNFDIVSFMSHPCYEMTGIETKTCEENYDLTESLRSLLNRGAVAAELRTQGIVTTTVTVTVPQSSSTSSATSSAPAALVPLQQSSSSVAAAVVPVYGTTTSHIDIAERSKLIWNTCKSRFSGYDVSLCFYRNRHLIQRQNIEVEGNVY